MLNVPVTASANEIRERYRALSVIFHPDKQRNDRTKDATAMEFLELQKAYEGERELCMTHAECESLSTYNIVLSDPFLRQVLISSCRSYISLTKLGKCMIFWVRPTALLPSGHNSHRICFIIITR